MYWGSVQQRHYRLLVISTFAAASRPLNHRLSHDTSFSSMTQAVPETYNLKHVFHVTYKRLRK